MSNKIENTAKGVRDLEDEAHLNILKMINCPTILTGMSHEMRTHMNSIVAFSFLMSNGCSETEKNQYTNHILSSCEQLMVLFDNFLDSAIIDTGNSKPELKGCKLGSVLEDLLSEFRVILKRDDHKDLVLILENQACSQAEVYLDSNRVTRIIRSLFQNALYNTSSGYIKIGYSIKDNVVTFYVLDSGDSYLKSRDFLQADDLNEALRKHNDTTSAISLTLARKLTTLIGGKIWIEANGVSGSGLFFSVPVRPVESPHVSINKYTNTRIAI
ncbi:MAG: HAMP domain-containing sensor histidine kinase [Bacteroidales bacterium]